MGYRRGVSTTRALLLTCSALLLGTLAFALLSELLAWLYGAPHNPSGWLSLLSAATVAVVSCAALQYGPFRKSPRLQYVDLPLIGILSAAAGLAVLGVAEGILPALLANLCAAVMLGVPLLHERRRSGAERNLGASEAHLAGQAQEGTLARDTGESANRAKSLVLANMSHELRTPLNAILGYAQLLLRERNLTDTQVAACETIQQSGEHLLMLIVDLLDLAKGEGGRLELQLDAADLRLFLQGIVDIIRIRAQDKLLRFGCAFSSDLPAFVQIDPKRLRQVLLNLLANAIQFTDTGRVEFEVKLAERTVETARLVFSVRDTGSGIPQAELERIFRPFEQVGDVQQPAGGTGLGLSLSRHLIRLMGGEIQVQSEWGEGSCFSFELLVATMDGPAARTVTNRVTDGSMDRSMGYAGQRRYVSHAGNHDPFEIPDAEQMETLRHLAESGNMRAIREQAQELASLNERYQPFADRITELALGYQSKALLRLVQQQIARQQAQRTEQVVNS
jgi:signal transduction histidine kinase